MEKLKTKRNLINLIEVECPDNKQNYPLSVCSTCKNFCGSDSNNIYDKEIIGAEHWGKPMLVANPSHIYCDYDD